MRLRQLLQKVPPLRIGGTAEMDFEVSSLEYDSRQAGPHSIFFAIQGEVSDGHRFIPQALERGAAAVVSERPAPNAFPVPWIETASIRPYMALLANEFCGHPSHDLNLVGVTGTNGKTTTAYLLHAILEQDQPSLMLGTISSVLGGESRPSLRTTPEAIDIQEFLARGKRLGCRHGVLEVSSHALHFYRVYQCWFRVGVFTNFSQDHLDFHGTMEDYFDAKCRLFERDYNPGLEHAVINADDPRVRTLEIPSEVSLTTFGYSSEWDLHPVEQELSIEGIRCRLRLDGDEFEIRSRLVGRHNLYNLMAATAAARRAGINVERIRSGVAALENVPGRFERVDLEARFSVFVDYAHTPEALANVLALARQVGQGRVICLFGAGGDRDRSKRPQMGAVVQRLADLAIVTSDNPRSEDPDSIIAEIEQGMDPHGRRWISITNRRQAITRALSSARPGDLVLLAGKGHETYQEIDGEKLDFDDRLVAREVL